MKHLTIIVPDGTGNNLSSIVGAYKIFTRANKLHEETTGKPLFEIQLAGISKEVDFYDGLFTVKPHIHISSVSRTDLIIIPSLNHAFQQAVNDNGPLIDWIEKQYKAGAEVASICTGAFMLAATGILDNRQCSTHWSAADHLRTMFPKIQLQTDQLITDEHGIYTNGGAYSFLNLIIYLIEKYYGRPTAIYCSKVFQIEMHRPSQSTFAIFKGQKKHGDEMVIKAQEYIEDHLHEKISIDDLTSELAVGRRNFDRRFTKATGNSPIEYTQRVKIESAKKTLESTRKTINEVMYEVGYSDLKAFREVFRKVTGVSPLEYRGKYGRGGG